MSDIDRLRNPEMSAHLREGKAREFYLPEALYAVGNMIRNVCKSLRLFKNRWCRPPGYLLALLASRFIPETEMDAMIDAGIDHIGCHEVRAGRGSAGRRPRFVDDSLLEGAVTSELVSVLKIPC